MLNSNLETNKSNIRKYYYHD